MWMMFINNHWELYSNSIEMFTLVTYFNFKRQYSATRLTEFQFALSKNQQNPQIKKIVVLCASTNFVSNHQLAQFLIQSRIQIQLVDELVNFRDLLSNCHQWNGRRLILTMPDIYFPVNSGIGSLSIVDLHQNIVILTPYHLTTGELTSNLYTGIIKSYQNQKLKLHKLDGQAIGTLIFQLPLKTDMLPKLNEQLDYNFNQYYVPGINKLLRKLSNQYHLANPALDLVSIKLFQKWHPQCEQSQVNQTKQRHSFKVVPVCVLEINQTGLDVSSNLNRHPIEMRQNDHNIRTSIISNISVPSSDQLINRMIGQIAFHPVVRNNSKLMNYRLSSPEQVTKIFWTAQLKKNDINFT